MDPQMTIAPGRIDVLVWGERFATYDTAATIPGFSAIHALGLRAVMQPFTPVGQCLWVCHGNVNGVAYGTGDDHSGGSGRIVTDDLTARRGSQSVGFQHECSWIDPAGTCILRDVRTVRAAQGPCSGAILDLRVVITSASEEVVTIGPTESSLVCASVAPQLLPSGGGQLRNSNDEFGPEGIHGRQAAWCACNGVVLGDTVGFAFLDHPDNLWYPTPWCCREDGFLSPSPYAWRSESLQPGESLDLRYRILVHSGYVEAGWVRERRADWLRSTRA